MNRPDGIAFSHPASLIATWFGAGLIPKAPGTWGSLAALPFAWVILEFAGWPWLALATLLAFLAGLWASAAYCRAKGLKDPGEVVIDEVAGQWLALLAATSAGSPDPLAFAVGFAAFRLFDIVKPWPVGWADRRLPGALGVMADDILAGLYGLACVAGYLGLADYLSGGAA
ncbi:phosphatidylglycerophosphatase A family protein [Oceanibacterium hippocampi]|uniref:Phosphatidylglycerophosphatase A n=1 Tax=Oceanibacterium hippocampi TaxID=745714 RepID=A0A1Y5T3Q6_9PROT|nr:phosphatidylglycerophosphatase A [Oceanibacterium hippocampi]SLN54629.1 Phosphatidylglycerophosphatase A [Oceanibacterium hippocampi]